LDCAQAGLAKTAAPISNASAQADFAEEISAGFVEQISVKGASRKLLRFLAGL
jgi:hypothetical protein